MILMIINTLITVSCDDLFTSNLSSRSPKKVIPRNVHGDQEETWQERKSIQEVSTELIDTVGYQAPSSGDPLIDSVSRIVCLKKKKVIYSPDLVCLMINGGFRTFWQWCQKQEIWGTARVLRIHWYTAGVHSCGQNKMLRWQGACIQHICLDSNYGQGNASFIFVSLYIEQSQQLKHLCYPLQPSWRPLFNKHILSIYYEVGTMQSTDYPIGVIY